MSHYFRGSSVLLLIFPSHNTFCKTKGEVSIVCRLMVIDENGNQDKSKNCKVKSYSLSLDENSSLKLKIQRDDNKILELPNVINCFSDATCSVFRVNNSSYVISS